jgi:hypothetical protein
MWYKQDLAMWCKQGIRGDFILAPALPTDGDHIHGVPVPEDIDEVRFKETEDSSDEISTHLSSEDAGSPFPSISSSKYSMCEDSSPRDDSASDMPVFNLGDDACAIPDGAYGEKVLSNMQMFMDRRYHVLGNTFCNFRDTMRYSGARVRSSSWSHPRSSVASEPHLKRLVPKKSASEPRSAPIESHEIFDMALPHVANNAKPEQSMEILARSTTPPTTLIVKGIGNNISQKDLVTWWPDEEVGYNIFYMPYSFKRKKNLGFAFMNFDSYEAAKSFKERVHGSVWSIPRSGKRGSKTFVVDWAKVQGFAAHKETIDSYPQDLLKQMMFLPIVRREKEVLL